MRLGTLGFTRPCGVDIVASDDVVVKASRMGSLSGVGVEFANRHARAHRAMGHRMTTQKTAKAA